MLKNFINSLKLKFNVVLELFEFLWERKMWWLIPMVLVLILVGFLLMASSSPIAPFIYSIF